jgi:hypothetical protein
MKDDTAFAGQLILLVLESLGDLITTLGNEKIGPLELSSIPIDLKPFGVPLVVRVVANGPILNDSVYIGLLVSPNP